MHVCIGPCTLCRQLWIFESLYFEEMLSVYVRAGMSLFYIFVLYLFDCFHGFLTQSLFSCRRLWGFDSFQRWAHPWQPLHRPCGLTVRWRSPPYCCQSSGEALRHTHIRVRTHQATEHCLQCSSSSSIVLLLVLCPMKESGCGQYIVNTCSIQWPARSSLRKFWS